MTVLSSSSDYITSLPREAGGSTLQPLVSISGSGLERWHSILMRRNQQQYEQQVPDPSLIPFQLFAWSSAIVSSRAFTLPGDRSALVPIADILNHSDRSNCEIDRRDNSLVIHAHTDIEPESELTHCKKKKKIPFSFVEVMCSIYVYTPPFALILIVQNCIGKNK